MKKKFNCILLIDDDIATNEYHEIIIEHANVAESIYTADSGTKALKYLTSRGDYNSKGDVFPQPDLIFLDINMPAMNGFEFMEEYNKLGPDQKGKYIIVMLTSSLNPDDKKNAEEIDEIKDFKNKPLTIEMLEELVDTYLK